MSWLKSYQSLRSHPKTRKLGRRVGSVPCAIGHLHCLWWWCLDYAPDGNLTRFSHEDIAVACEWEDDPETIIIHLVECGFLDAAEDGLHIHDWWEYGGLLEEQREANRERARAAYEQKREAQKVSTRRLPTDCAESTGLDKKEKKEKRREEENGAAAVDNSTVHSSAGTDKGIPGRFDWQGVVARMKGGVT